VTRNIYGFHQRFRNMHGKPIGRWTVALFHRLRHAQRLHNAAHRYSDVGPIFKTTARIPKRFEEGEMKP
jgi:hypothetical protein